MPAVYLSSALVSHRYAPPMRSLLLALFVVLSSLVSADPVVGQDPCGPDEAYCQSVRAVEVSISPEGGTETDTAAFRVITVDISWCAGAALDTTAIDIRFDGTDVTSQFSYTPLPRQYVNGIYCFGYGKSVGQLHVYPGTHLFRAQATDGNAMTGSDSTLYAYAYVPPGPAPAAAVYGVEVTEPPASAQHAVISEEQTVVFAVTNTGNVSTTYTLEAICSGTGITATPPCTTSHERILVGPQSTANVGVNFMTTSTLGSTGQLRLKASFTSPEDGVVKQDSGSISVTLVAPGATGRIGDATSTAIAVRSACVTASVGAGGAFECGDLRLVHPLPTTTVLSRPRTPVLIYNSQHASPAPVLSYYFNPPVDPRGAPSAVVLTATFSHQPGVVHADTFPGWPTGTTRRLTLLIDAREFSTGVYQYSLGVRAIYPDGTSTTSSQSPADLVVVNRGSSAFGPGWWLAGLEQLHFLNRLTNGRPHILWVGGDGSARIYLPDPTDVNRWTTRAYASADTAIMRDTVGAPSPAGFYRPLAGGSRIEFSPSGLQVGSQNALRHSTIFTYDAASRLSLITLPAGGLVYDFRYNSAGKLRRVLAPSAGTSRYVDIRSDGYARVSRIVDPGATAFDSTFVGFGYSGTSLRPSYRMDRRGFKTEYFFGAAARLDSVRLDLGSANPAQRYLTTSFQAAESRGTAAAGIPPAASEMYTRIDGPRTDGDTTRIWVDRYGAPTKVQNALGHVTLATRSDRRFPGLVTRTQAPNGRVITASYDGRGNLASQTDWSNSRVDALGRTHYATTTYEWHPDWDALTRVTLPEGEVQITEYDEWGRVTWSQPGFDPSRGGAATYFAPNDSAGWGQLQSVKAPLSTPQFFSYDELGNLASSKTIDQNIDVITEHRRDGLGRDTAVIAPNGTRVSTVFDMRDRVLRTTTRSASVEFLAPYPANTQVAPSQTLIVATYPNAEGAPDSVARWEEPLSQVGRITTHWRYDGAGRTVVEIAPSSTAGDSSYIPRDSTVYDPSGTSVRVRSRRGYWTEVNSDVLGRMVRRTSEAVTYVPRAQVSLEHNTERETHLYFPLYVQATQGHFTSQFNTSPAHVVRIPGDTARFEYDAMSNMTAAINADAVVRREYNLSGTLKSETQRIRTYIGSDTATHSYRLDYEYDLGGRRTRLVHPENFILPGAARPSTRYSYDSETGALTTITDTRGAVYRYAYNAAGQVDSLVRGPVRERFEYDTHGRLLRRVEQHLGSTVHEYSLQYNPLSGKLIGVSTPPVGEPGAAGATDLVYTGLGALVMSAERGNQSSASNKFELYETDALGNQLSNSLWGWSGTQIVAEGDGSAYSRTYEPGTGRLLYNALTADPQRHVDSVHYDAAGNRELSLAGRSVATPYALVAQKNGSYGIDPIEITFGTRQENVSGFLTDISNAFYGADERLRVLDRRGCLTFNPVFGLPACDQEMDPAYESRSAFEEYRYDALGRRVLVRTRQTFACTARCLQQVRRTVYDGDQVLYEIAAPGGDTASVTSMERDTGLATRFRIHAITSDSAFSDTLVTPNRLGGTRRFFQTGRVEYVHGGVLDAPLALYREEYSDSITGGRYVPMSDWRGAYDSGDGPAECYEREWTTRLQEAPWEPGADTTSLRKEGGTEKICADIEWPAQHTWSFRQYRRGYNGPTNWMGSLIYESRDASGLHYRRNRFYDAEQGRFTQEDPIGMAGGINIYGFAEGDPVTYADPYGLSASCDPPKTVCPTEWVAAATGWAVDQVAKVPVVRDLPFVSTAVEARRAQAEVRQAAAARDEFFSAESSLNLSSSNPNADRDAERLMGLSRAHQSQVAQAGAAMGRTGVRVEVNAYSAAAAANAKVREDFSLLQSAWSAVKSVFRREDTP